MVRLEVKLPDVSGALAALLGAVAETRANIVQVQHDRTFKGAELNEAVVELVLETRGFEHLSDVRNVLRAGGYSVTER